MTKSNSKNCRNISYYQLTQQEIQDLKDEIPLNLQNHKHDYDSVYEIMIQESLFIINSFRNMLALKGSRVTANNCFQKSKAQAILESHVIAKTQQKAIASQRFDLSSLSLNFSDNFGFKDSQSLILHLCLITNPLIFLTLHSKYQTIDKVLYSLKDVKEIEFIMSDYNLFANTFVRQDILDDPYFQKELNRIKLVNSSI